VRRGFSVSAWLSAPLSLKPALDTRRLSFDTLNGPDDEPNTRKTKIANQNKAVIAMVLALISSGAIT